MYDDRETSVNIVTTTLAILGWTRVLGFNPRRLAIVLTAVGAAPIVYSWAPTMPIPVASTPPGMSVFGSLPVIKRCDVGTIIQQDLYASDGGLGTTVAVTEIIEPWNSEEMA